MAYSDNKYLILNKLLLCDLELIMNSALYPLAGFMCEREYCSVLESMCLLDGSLFALPVNLPISECEYENIKDCKYITLKDEQLFSLALVEIIDIYKPDLEKECLLAYSTTDTNHPYVNCVMNRKNMYYVGCNIIENIHLPRHYDFTDIRLTPKQTKEYFKNNDWSTIIGFQTRNPMHKSHYELTKFALRCAGPNAKLLLHPSVAYTQTCDVDYHVRVKCLKEMVKYYNEGQVLLSLLQLCMRMAGPREAIHHAIIRQNYGCTHFIVGRDHAGPSYKTKDGSLFYGPYDAQQLALQKQDKLNIKIIVLDNIVYVKELRLYMQEKDVNSNNTILNISGTEQRKMLSFGQTIPEWYAFPEVANILKNAYANKTGICFYFIGLSGAGKSTLACALIDKLQEEGRKITYLDGDNIRLNLSKGLGFSKDDRSTNVRRIGFVSGEVVKHSGICVVANIAPYDVDRKFNRNLISEHGHYVQIFVNTTITVCEERDCKGLYKLARNGTITNFTGINDPFEIPDDSEIILDGQMDIDTNIKIIYEKVAYLLN